MSEATKQKIIEIGAEIIQRNGFNNTGIQEILNAAKIPKGSFYFYFKNKEDFGLQVIDYYIEASEEAVKELLKDKSYSPMQRFERFFNCSLEFFKSQKCNCGCPIGNLVQEMADLNPRFREKLCDAMNQKVGTFIDLLEDARKAGEISKNLDIESIANFMASSLQGAFLQMKVNKNTSSLENWYKIITCQVLGSSTQPNT